MIYVSMIGLDYTIGCGFKDDQLNRSIRHIEGVNLLIFDLSNTDFSLFKCAVKRINCPPSDGIMKVMKRHG